jgi:proteic killer suppression protein
MIVNFRDGWLHDFFADDIRSKKIPPDLEARPFRKLQMIVIGEVMHVDYET